MDSEEQDRLQANVGDQSILAARVQESSGHIDHESPTGNGSPYVYFRFTVHYLTPSIFLSLWARLVQQTVQEHLILLQL